MCMENVQSEQKHLFLFLRLLEEEKVVYFFLKKKKKKLILNSLLQSICLWHVV